jgi:hypothetical protein
MATSFTAAAIPIANSALTDVGTRLILTTTDSSKECTLVTQNWDTYRRAVLMDGLWKFSKNLVVLRMDNNFQAQFGFMYRYFLPKDFLRLIEFNDTKGNSDGSDAPWRIMGGMLFTNFSYANIVYVGDVTDVSKFDPLFCEALSAYIAMKLCKTLTGLSDISQFVAQYKLAKQKASFVDSTQDPSTQLDVDVWLQSRVGISGMFRDPQFAQDPALDFPAEPEE